MQILASSLCCASFSFGAVSFSAFTAFVLYCFISFSTYCFATICRSYLWRSLSLCTCSEQQWRRIFSLFRCPLRSHIFDFSSAIFFIYQFNSPSIFLFSISYFYSLPFFVGFSHKLWLFWVHTKLNVMGYLQPFKIIVTRNLHRPLAPIDFYFG